MKGPSTLQSLYQRALPSFEDQGPLQTAGSFPAFEAALQPGWLLHFVSLPHWQKCMPVRSAVEHHQTSPPATILELTVTGSWQWG